MLQLVDTHCHLFVPPLCDHAEAALLRAAAAGVSRVVVPAYDRASWDAVQQLARARPSTVTVAPALGLHPWAADEGVDDRELRELRDRLIACGAVAVGEIGLDHAVARTPGARARQAEVLGRQLGVARDLDLPVILHCREAFDVLFELLADRGPLRGVLHGFGRGPELARRITDAGLHVAFNGLVTRPGARRARAAAAQVAADRLLLETDAPSAGLHGVEPERVEPAALARIADEIAILRQTTTEQRSPA